MTAIPLVGARSDPARLSWREVLSFGAGSVASNLSWNMVAGFLIVFYTDVALLPAALVGTLVLVTRLLDAIVDPVVGIVVDRTRTRFGQARPYLLYAAVPFGVLAVMTFITPAAGQGVRLAYAYATFCLLGVLYSFLYVPYSALQPMMTQNGADQLRLSSFRAMGTSVASIFVYGLVVQTIALIGHGDQKRGYAGAAVVFAVVTAGLYAVTFFNCKERHTSPAGARRVPLSVSIPQMFTNRIWLIAMIFELLIFIRLGVLASVSAYYARLVLHDRAVTGLLLTTMSVGILTGGYLGAPWMARFGKKAGIVVLLVLTIACFAALPFATGSLPLLIGLFYLATVSGGAQAVLVFTLIAEAVQVQEARTGARDEGMLSSVASFNQKVGFAIGSAVLAYALAAADYDPHVAHPSATRAVQGLFSGLPIAVSLLQIATISFYRGQPAAGPARAVGPA